MQSYLCAPDSSWPQQGVAFGRINSSQSAAVINPVAEYAYYLEKLLNIYLVSE